MDEYGQLPDLHYLNRFMRMEKSARRFTPVGYGLEKSRPKFTEGGDTRRKANVKLITLKGQGGAPAGTFATFSNNLGTVHQGGTCFGDSGGPIFDAGTRMIVAVNSFVLSPNCTGLGAATGWTRPMTWVGSSGGSV